MQTSAHPPGAKPQVQPQRQALTPRRRAPRPAPFPTLPAAGDPTFWAVALQQNQLAAEALERQLDANARSGQFSAALDNGLRAGLQHLEEDSQYAAAVLLGAGRILMAVPARGQQ